MVTREDALAIAQAELATWKFDRKGDVLILIASKTIEKPYAWVVFGLPSGGMKLGSYAI